MIINHSGVHFSEKTLNKICQSNNRIMFEIVIGSKLFSGMRMLRIRREWGITGASPP